MRTGIVRSVAAGLVLALAGVVAAQPADDARAILDKAVKAHGGEAALKKYQAARSKNKGTIEIAGGSAFTQETAYQAPNKFRDEMELEIANQKVKVLTVYDGKDGAITVNGKKLPLNDAIKEALKEAGEMVKTARLEPLRGDKELELSTLGEAQVNGKPAVGVRAAKKGQRDLNLYFDKKTGMLVKIERRTLEPMSGQEITEERIIAEYQTVSGIPVAKKVVVNRDGKKFLEAEVQEVRLLESLDDGEFMLPQ